MPVHQDVDFEDDRAFMDKETQTRRRHQRWFNKRRDNFKTDAEYDDYLEMVEDILYNLVNGIDMEKTKARVLKYRHDNQHVVGEIQAKRTEEDIQEAELVALEERARIARLNELRKQDEALERERLRKRQEADAVELLRVSHGEDAVARLNKRREKAERKKRKKEAAAARAAEEASKPDIQPMFYQLAFPSAPPRALDESVYISQKPSIRTTRLNAEDQARSATAAGFRQRLVYERALGEFNQSLSVLTGRDSYA